MIFLQKHSALGPWIFGALLLLCACFAHATVTPPPASCSTSGGGSGACYIDCNNGSNGAAGTFDAPWRTPLSFGLHTFTAGDSIYLHRDCAWNDGISFGLPSWGASSGYAPGVLIVPATGNAHYYENTGSSCTSGTTEPAPWNTSGSTTSDGTCTWQDEGTSIPDNGTSGNPIVIDSYGGYNSEPYATGSGTGAPSRMTGYLPVPAVSWAVSSGHIWVSKPLYSSTCSSDHNCVQCPSQELTYSCLDQPLGVLNYVRFGTVWGNIQTTLSLTQDRDWYYDTTAQQLYVYCTCTGATNPQTYYGQVVPIAVGNEASPASGGINMLKLNNVQWLQVQHLLLDWYDSVGAIIQGSSDHIWLANIAANSYVENGIYRSTSTGALCPVTTSGCSQYTQIGFWAEPSTGSTACGGSPCGQDIHLWNVDANMNYQGYKFGKATGSPGQLYDLQNCRAYANRTYAIVDDTNGGVSHDYCHFYANNLATTIETDFATDCTGSACSGGTPYPAPACGAHDIPGANCNKVTKTFVLQGPGDNQQSFWSGVRTYLEPNPAVYGGAIQFWWSDFDTGSGYNFAYLDALVQEWAGHGKKVRLILQAVQSAASASACTVYNTSNSGTSSIGNCATPAYVWSALTSSNYSSCGLTNTQRIPNWLNATFQADYKAAIQALVAHYSGNTSIDSIRIAFGRGGEMLPDSTWSSSCLTQLETWSSTGSQSAFVTAWETYLSGMAVWAGGTNFSGAKSTIPLLGAITPMGSPSTQVPDYIAPIYAANGIGFGSQGLEASDVNNCSGATADWCSLFSSNPSVPHELQTLYNSCAPGQSCSGLQASTGPLSPLLAFAAANGVNSLEIYWEDWLTGFDASYRSANGLSSAAGANYAAYLNELPFPAATPPWVQQWKRWPAYVSLTYDDPGLVQYSDEYINQLLGLMTAKSLPLSMAIVTGGDYSQSIVSRVQGWIDSGWDIVTHSKSHEYWAPPAINCGDDPTNTYYAASATTVPCHAFTGVQYTGSVASSVTLTISHSGSGGTLTMTPSPFDQCAYHVWDLTPVAPGATGASSQIDTLGTVFATLSESGCFTITLDALAKGDAHAYGLADVTNLDIKTSAQNLDFSEQYLENDEMGWANSWMNHYLTGMPANRLYVMPSSFEDTRTETYASTIGFAGVRGSGSLRPCCAANTTLANGYDVLNILSSGINPLWQNLTYSQFRQGILADTFKNALWGRPAGFFWHIDELPYDQVENMVDALEQGGATLLSDTGLMNFLLSCSRNDTVPPAANSIGGNATPYVAGSFYACPSTGTEADWRQTLNSPTVGAGSSSPGSSFEYDLRGNNRNSYGAGWDIGAFQYIPMSIPK